VKEAGYKSYILYGPKLIYKVDWWLPGTKEYWRDVGRGMLMKMF
jgi:hypothetical protein